MSEVLREFKIAVGLDTKELNQGIKSSENSLMSFGKAVGGIFATYLGYEALKSTIFGFTELADKIGHTSKMMGYSVEDTHALGNALKRFGGNTDSAISSLNSLSSALQDAKFGGGALVEVAKKYGIGFMESNGQLMSAENLLKSLGKQMQGYDKLTQMEIGKKLGLDDSLILALQNGGVELERLIKRQKELGVITQKDYDLAQEFGNAWEELKESFKAISMQVARTLMPVLKKMIDGLVGFVDFLKNNKALVIGFFGGLAIALAPILAQFIAIAGASITAFAPLYAVVGVVTAIALVAEDIWVYFQGGDSVVGELAKKFPIIGSLLEGIRPIVMGIVEAFKDIVKWLENPSWEGLLDIFKKWGNAIYTYFKEPIEEVKKILNSMFEDFKAWLENPSWEGLINTFKKWGNAIYEYLKKPLDYILEILNKITGGVKGFIADSWVGSLLGMKEEENQNQTQTQKPKEEEKKGFVDSVKGFFGGLFGGDGSDKKSIEGKEAFKEGMGFSEKEKIENNKLEKEKIENNKLEKEKIESNKELRESSIKEVFNTSSIIEKEKMLQSPIPKIDISLKEFKDNVAPSVQSMPTQPITQTTNQQSVSNTYNVNASVNQSITSPTPQALADQASSAIIDSINNQRQMIGANYGI